MTDTESVLDAEIQHVYDVPYAFVDGIRLTLDLHFIGHPQDHPVLVWFHGGGWQAGDSRTAEQKILWSYARTGITVASINYRLSTQAHHPAQLLDAFAAIAWLGTGTHGFAFDLDRVYAGGGSAGGHLAWLVGLNQPLYRRLHGLRAPRVNGVVALYPVTDPLAFDGEKLAGGVPPEGTFARAVWERRGGVLPQLGAALLGPDPVLDPSPFPESYREVDAADIPPFLILHGSNDSDVPVRHGLALYDVLLRLGVDATLLIHGDADHGSPRFHGGPALAATTAFVHRTPPIPAI